MSLLVIGVFGISGFVILQLYYEGLHLITLATQVANHTFVSSVQFQQWLKETVKVQNISQLTDYIAENAISTGRNHFSSQVFFFFVWFEVPWFYN
ncbi:MAG: hypothetical protein GY696_37720 [Gammaproteobacteria bacterium]|nr:hypothetical protein [Gammaproteobacteria bacterium]